MRVLKAVPDRVDPDVVYFLVDYGGELMVMRAIWSQFDYHLNHIYASDSSSKSFRGSMSFIVFSAEQIPDDLREAYEKAQSERQRRTMVGHTPLLEEPNSP
jgi:hypothetical protein